MPRALVVLNPAASRAPDERRLASLFGPLHDEGWSVEMRCTDGRGAATALARAAVDAGYEVVVAAGGDGTINEVVQALAHSETILGVLPLGMVNLWAYETGIPGSIGGAARVLAAGEVRRVDLGVASLGDGGRRYFLLMAGIGFDAEVVRRMEPSAKRLLGPLAFVGNAFRAALDSPGARVEVDLPAALLRQDSMFLLAGNTRRYAGRMRVTPHARVDDGLLDLCLFPGRGFWKAARYAAELLVGRHLEDPTVIYHVVPRALVRATPALPVQLDGEFAGTTPVELRCEPLALRVLVPAGYASGLLSVGGVPGAQAG